ncbi:UPF0500 protein C1orf216 homolog isoform X2 [Myripristis murdjan]|nr:UPF0500 protein C1orf216 homolog isoform X2 [Myripristis murdjan]
MLHHQDRPLNSAYRGQGGTDDVSSPLLRNRKCDKDGNFNFLPSKDDEGVMMTGSRGGDENRNQVRPRNLGPMGRDPPSSSAPSGYHHNPGLLSPRSRLPCWSPLEPLPEIESGDDGYGRVPPDGAEEGKMEEETGGGRIMMSKNDEKVREAKEGALQRRKWSVGFRGGEEEEEEEGVEDDEWGDSDSEFEISYQSGSMSSLNMESGGEGVLMGGWDRVGVGEPKSHQRGGAMETDPTRKWDSSNREPMGRQRIVSRKPQPGASLEDDREDEDDDQSSDSDGELPELMDAVWTLRDRERFKAQEMEKHQVQLTMYRRLALIRWVRTLQGRVQEQQNRLQSSFDVILTHRKELLRMGAAAAVSTATAPPATAVSQS